MAKNTGSKPGTEKPGTGKPGKGKGCAKGCCSGKAPTDGCR